MLSFSISGKKKGTPGGVTSQTVFSRNNKEEEGSSDEEKDYVKSIEGREIVGTKKKATKAELVIPLIGKNEWRGNCNDEELLEQQAIREILGSANANKQQEDEDEAALPILLKNRIPGGFETDDNLNVSLRPDQPTLDDYTKIPIEEFGMAMLRGMGWKKGEGIGLTNKKVVEVTEPRLRPRGLGLGAERPQVGQTFEPTPKGKKDDETLTLKKGACVLVNQGVNRGRYGKVEAFDEDNNRVIIQLAIGSKMVGISKYKIVLVSEEEFNRKSKILNNALYEEYKKKQDEHDLQRQKISTTEGTENSRSEEDKTLIKSEKSNKQTERDRTHTYQAKLKECWVVPNLRVRFIDPKYRNGKYYKKKFVVEDVTERDRCVLKSDDGDVLDRIKSSQIETVIPKSPSSAVFILHGREKGKIGSLITRDMKNELGVVKIPDEGVVELHFDDICEIVGDFDDLL